MSRSTPIRTNIVEISVGLIVLLWLAVACLWMDRPGLHYDETIFVAGTFPEKPGGAVWKVDVMGSPVAVLIMSYMGALKGWMYRGLLAVAEPTAATVRFPLLLLAAMTIAATYHLAATMFGRSTGLVATVLLTTDVTFLLTSKLDWGPVVVQRFCLVVGVLLLLTGSRDGTVRLRTVAGALVLGLALFDKLTFFWIVFGLFVSLLLTFPRVVSRVAANRLLPLCITVVVLPALPSVYYRTFRLTTEPITLEQHPAHLQAKYGMLMQSLDGTVLRSSIAYQSADHPASATDLPTGILYRLDSMGTFEAGWFRPTMTLALLLLPLTVFLPGGRGRVFVVLFCLFSLLPMALIEGAGSVHHATLIYPFPHIFVASSLVSLTESMRPRLGRNVAVASVIVVTAVIAGSNARNIVHQYAEVVRFGGRPIWSEAIYELSEVVGRYSAEHVLVGDWGIEHQLIFLSNNELSLSGVSGAGPENEEALRATVAALKQPNTILVRYASVELSPLPMRHDLVDQAAGIAGIELQLSSVIEDRQHRPIYHVYRLRNVG